MAKISLRLYIQEIDGLIEHGQTDEAIAHCKHILKYYPKHIDTYRMLGKAYLESQRYSEAADVLHRVLSVFPDDFVSQIGMSIIREDEGNLDAAIWHMERTFEVQPANTAVQDELRRLYGRRDGVEPPKVRLTRGALARLYARGELYPQAIAEIRAALAEDPERVDLEVVLAQTYYASGQKVEATETCSRLVSKLPFCYEANRLLVEILPGTSRAEDAKTYQQRIFALDPYTAYISSTAPTVSQVPDNAITLDHLDWEPAQESAQQQPEWAKTVGIDLGEAEEPLPDWLTPMPTPPTSPNEEAVPEEITSTEQLGNLISSEPEAIVSNSPSEDQIIPDWMKTAGWAQSIAGETEVTSVPEGTFEEEIAPADIPDWLQSFAPSDDSAQEQKSPEEPENLETADNILPSQPSEAVNHQINPVLSTTEGTQPEAEEGMTQPETEAVPESSGPITSIEAESPPSEALPDWLKGLETGEKFEDKVKSEDEEIPAWLSDLGGKESSQIETAKAPAEELPEWIKQTSEEIPVDELTSEPQNAIAKEEHYPEPPEISQEQVPTGSTGAVNEVDAAMACLESLAAKQGAEEGTLTTIPEERLETPPEWVQREMVSNTPATNETIPDTTQPEQSLEETTPVTQSVEQTESIVSETEAAPAEAVSSEGLTLSSQQPEQNEPAPAEAEAARTPAPAVQETEIVAQTLEHIEPVISEITVPLTEIGRGLENPQVQVAEPGLNVETPPVINPDINVESPTGDAGLQTEIPVEPVSESSSENVMEVPLPSIESQPIPAQSIETQQVLTEEQPVSVPVVEEQPVSAPVTEEPSIEPVLQEEIPAAEVAQKVEPPQPDFSTDDGFAWLEALAAKQGADEATLIFAPEERSEVPPTWVSQSKTAPLAETPADQVSDESPETESETNYKSVSKTPESLGIGLPDWLKSDDFIQQEESIEPFDQEKQSTDSSLPDWLKEIETEEPLSDNPTEPVEETAAQVIPDWLQEVNIEAETPVTNEAPQTVEAKEESLHEWLESLEKNPEEEPKITLEESTFIEPAPLPEWLQGLEETSSQAAETTPETGKSEEVPVWVNELDNLSVEEIKPGVTKELVFPSDQQSVEPETSTESIPESIEQPESIQSENIVPAVTTGSAETLEPSIPSLDNETLLSEAQTALDKGKLKEALLAYTQLISSGQLLDETVHDLRDALYRYPVDIGLWQALGDAYVRSNHLQDALDAYTKAEELLR
ncbi:MAG TPA: tetratricopeptide repeat protein [Anaerolineaceae bacterium]|nr:tetratricopeptide repeat protein [Anaerolineaceae bacterium]